MYKDFDNWNSLKEKLHCRKNAPMFGEREVWWCSLGCNIGDEQDGKGVQFARPVLVIRKFNKNLFLGIPLSTKVKDKDYYYKFTFKENIQCLIFSQIRMYDSKRLLTKMERISENQFDSIKKDFIKYIFKV